MKAIFSRLDMARPFFMGQAAHTIGDSFAHGLRNYRTPVIAPAQMGGTALPISAIRETGGSVKSEDDADALLWTMTHSDCYDHDCEWGGSSPWAYNSYAKTGIYNKRSCFR